VDNNQCMYTYKIDEDQRKLSRNVKLLYTKARQSFFKNIYTFLLKNNLRFMTRYWVVVNNQKGNIQSSHPILVKKSVKN